MSEEIFGQYVGKFLYRRRSLNKPTNDTLSIRIPKDFDLRPGNYIITFWRIDI